MAYPNLGPMRPIVNIHWPGRYIAVRFRTTHSITGKGGPIECSPSAGTKPLVQPWTEQYLTEITFQDLSAPLSALLTTDSGETWTTVISSTTFDGLPSTSEAIAVASPWQWEPDVTAGTIFFPIAGDSDLPVMPQSGGTERRFGLGTSLIVDIYTYPRDDDFVLTCWTVNDGGVLKDYTHMISTLNTTGAHDVAASKSFSMNGFEATHNGRTYEAFAVQSENNDGSVINPDFERDFWVLMKPKPAAAA